MTRELLEAAVGIVGTTFKDTISTGGAILTAALAIGSVVGLVYGVKWKATAQAGQATIDLWKDNAAGEASKAASLTAELARSHETTDRKIAEITILRAEVAELKSHPNLERLIEVFAEHENRAQQRHEAMLEVLQALTERLISTSTSQIGGS